MTEDQLKRREEEKQRKEEISKRLVEALKASGTKNGADLANVILTPHTTANNYMKGLRLPPLEVFSFILEALDKTNIRWILTGEGSKDRSDVLGGDGFTISEIIRLNQENEDELIKDQAFQSFVTRAGKKIDLVGAILKELETLKKELREFKSK